MRLSHEARPPQHKLDVDRLREAHLFLRDLFKLWRREWIPEKRTLLIAYVYDFLTPENTMEISLWVASQMELEQVGWISEA